MSHVNDAKHAYLLAATSSAGGHIDDLEQTWLINFIIGPITGQEQINDLYNLWYDEQGISAGALPDRHYEYLRGKGYTGTLNDMWYQFWTDISVPFFSFAGDGYIDCPPTIDWSKPNKLEYSIGPGANGGGNRDIWSTLDNSCIGRYRGTYDWRSIRGGGGANLNSVVVTPGEAYNMSEIAQPVESISIQRIDRDTLVEQSGVAAVGLPGAILAGFRIGGNLGTSLYIGRISDFKIYDDANVLIHHWPINEGAGTIINDIVGSAHGTLVPGTGGWSS